MVTPLTVDECKEKIGSDYPSDFIDLVFSIPSKIINFLAEIYELDGPVPPIGYFDSSGIEAYAGEDGVIYIRVGIIRSCLIVEKAFAVDLLFYLKALQNPMIGVLPIVSFAWIVAHEFFHLSRSHYTLRGHFLVPIKVCEFDADNLATAGVFQYFRFGYSLKPAVRSIEGLKICLLCSIFWTIRSEYKSSDERNRDSKSHPGWFQRLIYCAKKMAMMGIVDPDFIAKPNWPTDPQLLCEERKMFDILSGCEKAYINPFPEKSKNKNRKKFPESEFLIFMERSIQEKNLEAVELENMANHFSPEFEQCNLLRALRKQNEM